MQLLRTLVLAILWMSFSVNALAECAWVLWEEIESGGVSQKKYQYNEEWNLINAFESKKSCDATKDIAWKLKYDNWSDLSNKSRLENVEYVKGEIVLLKFKSGDFSLYQYRCLPDSIDPRTKNKKVMTPSE